MNRSQRASVAGIDRQSRVIVTPLPAVADLATGITCHAASHAASR